MCVVLLLNGRDDRVAGWRQPNHGEDVRAVPDRFESAVGAATIDDIVEPLAVGREVEPTDLQRIRRELPLGAIRDVADPVARLVVSLGVYEFGRRGRPGGREYLVFRIVRNAQLRATRRRHDPDVRLSATVGVERDPLAVRRPGLPEVVAHVARELARRTAVNRDDPDVGRGSAPRSF